MMKCKANFIIWADDDDREGATIGCDFESGHGGKHQKIMKEEDVTFTIRWKRDIKK